jgi:cytochrome c-type biogenesis protein CcmH
MRLVLIALVVLGTLSLAPPSFALAVDEPLPDPVLEARARAIHKILRCLVCQNQSIEDSNADLARDLRHIVRERLLEGDSDAEATQYVADRYGDWVLLRPPFKATTYALWIGPFALLAVAAAGIVVFLRRRLVIAAPEPLDEKEHERLRRVIEESEAG